MAVIGIFIVTFFLLNALNKCYKELRQIKEILRTKEYQELGEVLDMYNDEKK